MRIVACVCVRERVCEWVFVCGANCLSTSTKYRTNEMSKINMFALDDVNVSFGIYAIFYGNTPANTRTLWSIKSNKWVWLMLFHAIYVYWFGCCLNSLKVIQFDYLDWTLKLEEWQVHCDCMYRCLLFRFLFSCLSASRIA